MTRRLRVLDLFAGTGSATQAFEDRGHEVVRVEIDERFPSHIAYRDARHLAADIGRLVDSRLRSPFARPFDVVWASPPCPAFSPAGKGSHDQWKEAQKNGEDVSDFRWHYAGDYPFYGPRFPNDKTARVGCALVLAALHIIKTVSPRVGWWMENPMGGLRTMGFMQDVPGPVTVTYCQYGERRMKPTDLWGVWPGTWTPRPKCKNGSPCHEASPRGSKTGSQGLANATLRAMIPYDLSLSVAKACEEASKEAVA